MVFGIGLLSHLPCIAALIIRNRIGNLTVMPGIEAFPYSVRVVSEITESDRRSA